MFKKYEIPILMYSQIRNFSSERLQGNLSLLIGSSYILPVLRQKKLKGQCILNGACRIGNHAHFCWFLMGVVALKIEGAM